MLDSKHPIPRSFIQYGSHAARHPVITLLISSAVAAILVYPFPFFYTNTFAGGASNLPHHVWTSALPLEGASTTPVDVIVRSIWVHGSYMRALEQEVLQRALEIQSELFGHPHTTLVEVDPQTHPIASSPPDIRDTLQKINGLGNSSFLFYSPLEYWSSSSEKVAEDTDILTTIDHGSQHLTIQNATIRPTIAFSGNLYEDYKLVATDALVMTLVYTPDSALGQQWEQGARDIARKNNNRWRVHPANGQVNASSLYEFIYQPLSYLDRLFLGVAYTLTILYFSISLSRLAAFKSRFGLIVAIASQIALTLTSSFTICAIFRIDVSKIPRDAFPLVILVIGLEDIFRIVNAFIATPSESSTAARMSQALGQTGFIALVGVLQNLSILWMFSKVVSPGVASFCVFVGIALAFDFFYLMMFFVPILSIDVRRTELSDALSRASMRVRHHANPEPPKKLTWAQTLVRGDVPVSTRVAGTLMMICFFFAAQSHFIGNETYMQKAYRTMWRFNPESQMPRFSMSPLLSAGMNQTGTPVAWIQMQDHETAREIISTMAPDVHSYIARVYDPLVFVLSGSDRTPTGLGARPYLPAIYDFVRHQSTAFVITVFMIVAAVSLLMNYLLWGELPEVEASGRVKDEPLLSVKTLNNGHSLDIVRLATSSVGLVVSVGLDRCTRVWDIRNGRKSYIIQDPNSDTDPFPILAMAIDSDSNWLALLSSKDFVALWNISERRWGQVMNVDMKGRAPAAFFFDCSQGQPSKSIILVRYNGLLSELHIESGTQDALQICKSPLVCVRSHMECASLSNPQPLPLRIIASSRTGCIHIVSKLGPDWISEEVQWPSKAPASDEATAILPFPALSSFLAVRRDTVELIDILTLQVTHVFATKSVKHDTLRYFHSVPRKGQCGSICLPYLALAYTNEHDGSCVVQTYLPRMEGNTVCFRCRKIPGGKPCLSSEIVENIYGVENPGEWDVLSVGYVVGVHKTESNSTKERSRLLHPAASGLRRRGEFNRLLARDLNDEPQDDQWEAWTLSLRGDKSTMKLSGDGDMSAELLVSSLGPIEIIGKRSVAVTLGNVVKIVTVGDEKYDNDDAVSPQEAVFAGTASGRKKRSSVGRKKYS